MKISIVLTTLLFYNWFALCLATAKSGRTTCGYDSCPKGNPDTNVINVHVVPHTHDDVGWLKTVDQYYFGSSTNYQRAGVRYILDSVIKELLKDPARRFIYVEMAFFWQWWQDQTEQTQAVVKQLVNEGRLEFINGGWCMNDEATTHYNDIIDQMTWGFRFLNDTFGECARPKIGWQIDPFGHSREQASLFASMGFDGMFFGRLDWVDRSFRRQNKELEMIWKASNSLGDRGSIFAGAFYDHYSAPPGFCFDVLCRDTPIIDNPNSSEYNVPARVDALYAHIQKIANSSSSNHIMFTMGDDFNYMTADMNFKNMDKMIKYTNERVPSVNLFYSTPSCYVKALNDVGKTWPTKTDDFFPYSNDPHAYWTGYFSSRPDYKGTVRKTNTYLQSCKQLHSLSGSTENQEKIDSLRRSMGEAQHHDAVAGTEKNHVSEDYRLRMHESTLECLQDFSNSLNKLVQIGSQPLPALQFCLQLNISECETSESNSRFVVTAYNPRSQDVTTYIRLPVTAGAYTVLDPDGSELVVQLVPLPTTAQRSIRRASTATHELLFQARNLPALGHKTFYILKTASQMSRSKGVRDQHTTTRQSRAGETTTITNEGISVNFDGNGMMASVTFLDGQTIPISQNLMWYAGMNPTDQGANPDDPWDYRPSGAYVFRPNGTDATPIATQATVTVQKGALVQEVHQQFADWASQVVRIYKGKQDIEIEWTVGPIPVGDGIGKEIINRVMTEVTSQGRFFTDSNGRQTLMRRRDFRPTWPLDVSEPVSENYYPINSHIYITDAEQNPTMAVSLVTDRAQGGTSLKDGQLELMVHRRLLHDDYFGVGEALNEPGDGPGLIARGVHYLLVKPSLNGNHPMSNIRPLAQEMMMRPWISLVPTDLSFTNWKLNYRTQKSGLKFNLPDNIHILTLEPWREDTHLLRLEHVYDIGEHPSLSFPVTLALDDILSDFTITSAEETVLGGNQWISDSTRLQWNYDKEPLPSYEQQSASLEANAKITVNLNPMEIKTFVIKVIPKHF